MQGEELAIVLITLALYSATFARDRDVGKRALAYSYDTFLETFFLLTAGIAVVGLMLVYIPDNLVIANLGRETGVRGILLGVAIGSFLPIGGYIRLPVVLALLNLGAGVGTVVAILSTRSLLYLPQSIAFYGPRVEAVLVPSFLVCGFSAGIAAHLIALTFI